MAHDERSGGIGIAVRQAPDGRDRPRLQRSRPQRHETTLVIGTRSRKSVQVTWLPSAMRLAWLTLPFTAGGVLADALDARSSAVQLTAAAIAWVAWAIVLVALLVRRPVSLTAVRVVAPLAFVACVVAALDRGRGVIAVVLTGVPLILAFLPETGAWLINGAAYGDERRYPLRAPGLVLAGPVELTWLVFAASVTVGPLLLAARAWVVGGVVTAVGVVVAAGTARAMHALSMRWVVLVPAGLVLKDHTTLTDPVLFQRREIAGLVAAPADTEALDLTSRSPGLAVELRLTEPATLMLVKPAQRESTPVHAWSLLFTPTRPGALLTDASTRRLPVR